MVTSLTSDAVFSDNIEPLLHRTLRDITSDESLHVNQKHLARTNHQLPASYEIDEYIYRGGNPLTKEESRKVFNSAEYDRLLDLELDAGLGCCDDAPQFNFPKISPKSFVDLILNPPSAEYRMLNQTFAPKCKTHGLNEYNTPMLIHMNGQMGNSPLTVLDIVWNMGYYTHSEELADTPLIELINAYGIEDKDGVQRTRGFNVSFYHYYRNLDEFGFESQNDASKDYKFRDSYSKLSEVAPYGEAFAWYRLAGWQAGSVRALLSRLDSVKKLIEISNVTDVHRCLRAGVPNVRELVKILKIGIPASSVEKAFRIGMTDPKFMKMIEDEDIDYELVKSMMEAA